MEWRDDIVERVEEERAKLPKPHSVTWTAYLLDENIDKRLPWKNALGAALFFLDSFAHNFLFQLNIALRKDTFSPLSTPTFNHRSKCFPRAPSPFVQFIDAQKTTPLACTKDEMVLCTETQNNTTEDRTCCTWADK